LEGRTGICPALLPSLSGIVAQPNYVGADVPVVAPLGLTGVVGTRREQAPWSIVKSRDRMSL
jgi:hypothetical protein